MKKPTIHASAVPARTHGGESWRERDQLIEILAIYKFVKVSGLLAIDFGIIKLLQPATAERVQGWILALAEGAAHPHLQRLLVMVTDHSPGKLQLMGVVALFFAMLYMIEGIGLWYQSRWAEYLTIVATALLIPLEVYSLTSRVTVLRVAVIVINVAAVIYLVYRLRHENERVRII